MAYAEKTSVSVSRTKADIEELISRYGAEQFVSGFKGNGVRPMMRGRVTAKYPHLVTLNCGTSITYVQILMMQRNGRKYID